MLLELLRSASRPGKDPLEAGAALDASGWPPRAKVPSLDDICYMNTASIGLMSRSALAEEEKFQRQLGLYGTTWFDEPTEVGVLEQARREAPRCSAHRPNRSR